MPWAPKRPCTFPGCPELTLNGRCVKHTREERKIIDGRRGSAASRGYDGKWQAARAEFLRLHPLCHRCHATGRLTQATVVDHVIAHKGDKDTFWDQKNWAALCKQCHDRKTAQQDGRWERRRYA